ncbi:MAG TPA: hypothetical protein VN442_03905 [Bryobacteraceae bacterium]|nr:hypothetical protein [Bryobacteraceae bacterium]
MSNYAFLSPDASFRLPRSFEFDEYIETEREFWALFPETCGKRVNFCQLGLTAQLYTESAEDNSELASDETYFLMPCPDGTMRPLRMRAVRRLTLPEYRMSHLTALKLMDALRGTAGIIDAVHTQVMGPELLDEL